MTAAIWTQLGVAMAVKVWIRFAVLAAMVSPANHADADHPRIDEKPLLQCPLPSGSISQIPVKLAQANDAATDPTTAPSSAPAQSSAASIGTVAIMQGHATATRNGTNLVLKIEDEI